jgi:hypothetical protein
MPFAKGHPKPPNSGKRKGSVNKGTERARRLIAEGDDKAIVDKVVHDAKAGDPVARTVYFRFLRPPTPQPKFVPASIGLKPAATAKEAAAQIAAVVARLDAGDLDLESSHALIEGLRAFVAAYSAAELEVEMEKFRRSEGEQ